MKKVLLYAIMASLICFNYACNEDNIPKDVQPDDPVEPNVKFDNITDANNCFAFTIFKEVSALSEEPNTFFSPLSLNMALGMLFNGASGDTRAEMAEVLGMTDFTDNEINEYYQKMSQALLEVDPLTEIGIANSIWYREGYPLKQPFIDVNQKYFDAMVQALNFSSPDAADIINNWCAEKTKDRIKRIIANPIPNNVMMYLINALYFKSQWQFEFDKDNTRQVVFTKTNDQQIKVNMMIQRAVTLPFYADQHLTCVEMPYGNQAFSMVAILPAYGKNIEQLIEYLDFATWKNIITNLRKQEIMLGMPRFKIECEFELGEPVEKVGMQRIFCDGFENISDLGLFVSRIKQKTFVEVNEEGTEAAAVTIIEVPTGESVERISFFANRPFMYLIKEKSTGAILFIGRMDEPKE